jgi:signal transduction histidine kinase
MTDSLRDTLAKLARKEAAAAVGEFAAALAHEVRNPLTSIRLDLERARERTSDAGAQEMMGRAVAEIERLDATVSGSLRIARSGNLPLQGVEDGKPARCPMLEGRGEKGGR